MLTWLCSAVALLGSWSIGSSQLHAANCKNAIVIYPMNVHLSWLSPCTFIGRNTVFLWCIFSLYCKRLLAFDWVHLNQVQPNWPSDYPNWWACYCVTTITDLDKIRHSLRVWVVKYSNALDYDPFALLLQNFRRVILLCALSWLETLFGMVLLHHIRSSSLSLDSFVSDGDCDSIVSDTDVHGSHSHWCRSRKCEKKAKWRFWEMYGWLLPS